MLIRRAEIEGKISDVRIVGSRIRQLGDLTCEPDESQLDAEGGALLPGLHDHHLHLLALAASQKSIVCGPPAVNSVSELRDALRRSAQSLPVSDGLRGVGYHESVGPLDRKQLDAIVSDRSVRIQHRSGALWILNSPACDSLKLAEESHTGIERGTDGQPTGRVYRADAWLRERLATSPAPDLASIGQRLALLGTTGVTDATPHNGPSELRLFSEARRRGDLPQNLLLMGREDLPLPSASGIERGAHKIMISETALPDFDALVHTFKTQHGAGRNIAIHCVTRTELVFVLSVFEASGVRAGDRIEHASIAPPECRRALARLGIAVVTQPNFIAERGDAYQTDVDEADLPHLYCGASFLAAGVRVGGGTDAPFGAPDPWAAMRAAVDRRTRFGEKLGADEVLAPEQALSLFTTSPRDPGGAPRRVEIGAPADLCLLDRPWAQARTELVAQHVRTTFCAGQRIE